MWTKDQGAQKKLCIRVDKPWVTIITNSEVAPCQVHLSCDTLNNLTLNKLTLNKVAQIDFLLYLENGETMI